MGKITREGQRNAARRNARRVPRSAVLRQVRESSEGGDYEVFDSATGKELGWMQYSDGMNSTILRMWRDPDDMDRGTYEAFLPHWMPRPATYDPHCQ